MSGVPTIILACGVYFGLLVAAGNAGTVVGSRRTLTRRRQVAPFCPRCSYDLRGRADTRCPECGLQPTLEQLWLAQLDAPAASDSQPLDEETRGDRR